MDLQNQQEEFSIPNVVQYPIDPQEGVVQQEDPIALDIPDRELHKIIDKRIRDSRNFFKEKYNLYERRHVNETFLFGRQIKEREDRRGFKSYEAKYLDNALYEIEESIKPLAMNKLPDMIVTPGNESQKSKDIATNVSEIVDQDIKKRNNRRVLGIGFKHLPVYFTGIIKARWNPELGKYGDYIFENVFPDYVDIDHTCPTNNADDMAFISQILPITIQECIMRFPEKKEALFTKLKTQGVISGAEDFTGEDMASIIKIREVWFKWYKKTGSNEVVMYENEIPQEPGVKWECIRGVVWKYEEVILKKLKNPNFDYEGEDQVFVYEGTGADEKRVPTDEEMMFALQTGQMPPNMGHETIYRNYFQMPRAPYFFMGYDQWNKIAYDETSRIEQNVRNQQNLDKRGKQIQESLDEKGKHIWSKDGGLEAKDVENMDMDDPNQDALVEGDVNKVHGYVPPRTPSPQEFADLKDTRDRMYGLAGASAVRGNIQSDVATTNQIAREADYTRADDLVEDTINAAAEWMAQWALQFIKLRYTEPHMRKLLGDKGTVTFVELKNDMIQDGMEVMIKASGTDKLKAQNNAMEMARLQLIDPKTFYENMGLSDPEGRTKLLLSFMRGAMDGYASYELMIQGIETAPQMVDQMLGAGAAAGIQGQPVPGAGPEQTVQPSPENSSEVPITPPVQAPEGSPRMV